MNILVCLKIVSQATFTDSLTDNDDRLSGGRLGINPADAYALELALRIKDNAPGDHGDCRHHGSFLRRERSARCYCSRR